MSRKTRPTVRIERHFDAPPEKVYDAWTRPELLRRWFAPPAYSVDRVEADLRMGGHFRVWQTDQDGAEVGGSDSMVVDLVPNRRLVLRWQFVGPGRQIDTRLESRLTVDLEATLGGTDLTLVHEDLEMLAAAMPEVVGGVESGWRSALDRLAVAGL